MGRFLLIAALAVHAFPLGADVGPSRKLVTGWYPWDPYNSVTTTLGNRHFSGLDVELTREALREAGFNLEIVEADWARQLADIEQGRQDVAMGVLPSDSRSPRVLYSKPYRNESLVLFLRRATRKRLPARSRAALFDQLQRSAMRIGVAEGYSYGDEADAWLALPAMARSVARAPGEYELVKMLDAGTIDAFIADRLVGTTVAWKSGLASEVEIHPVTIARHDVRVMFSTARVTRKDVEAFDRGMTRIRRNGTYGRIVRRYAVPLLLAETIDRTWFVVIDLLATIAFAISGVALARRGGYSVVGAFVLGSLPALGGGALRDLLAGRHPIGIVQNPAGFLCVAITVAGGYGIARWRHARTRRNPDETLGLRRYGWVVAPFDALGASALLVIGVLVALQTGCEPLFLWGPILATVGAVGGGILRDIVRADPNIDALKTNPTPQIVIAWALLLSLFFYWESSRLEPPEIFAAVLICLTGSFVHLMVAHRRRWRAHPFEP